MVRLIMMNAIDEQMVKKTEMNKQGCMNKHSSYKQLQVFP